MHNNAHCWALVRVVDGSISWQHCVSKKEKKKVVTSQARAVRMSVALKTQVFRTILL